ncbi:MAG: hypothetical protein QM817_41495 [Archangium sp.]
MKLMGKDITPAKVMAFVEERLAARGLNFGAQHSDVTVDGVEARVDPMSFNLQALEENADATRGLPMETHRDGLGGRAVLLAKRVFRTAGQIFINEALGRQRVFNGHVRDSYAQLSAEVMRLRARVAELEREPAPVASKPAPPTPPKPKPAPPAAPKPSAVKPKPVPPPPAPAKPSAAKPKRVPPPPPSAPPRNTRRGK